MSDTITNGLKSYFQDTNFVPAIEAAPDALILNPLLTTLAATPEGDATRVRIPFISEDPTAAVVAESAEIQAGDPKLAEVAFGTLKVGLIHRVSNEAYRSVAAGQNTDNPTSEQLTESLRRSITAKLDALFLNEAKDAENVAHPVGLAQRDDIIDGGTITPKTLLTPLIDAIATISDNGASPTAILTSNSAWAKLLKLAYEDGRPVINPDAQTEAIPQLLGLPVVRNAAVPADMLLVLDAANVVAAASDIDVETSTDAYFGSDCTAIRILSRIGWDLVRPKRTARVKINLAAAASTGK